MHLHFSSSFGFDNVYPKLVTQKDTALHGQLQVGQKGMLEWFELHLGLHGADLPDLIRISQYKKAVTAAIAAAPDLYIAASHKVDPWGTAKQLLQWRDELQLALWDFDCDDKSLDRLYTLSVVEGFVEKLAAGVNDRWRQVHNFLQSRTDFSVLHSIKIYEPEKISNPFFQQLFQVLKKLGVTIEYKVHDYSTDNTDLGRFKAKLLAPTKTDNNAASNDGSLTFIRADNPKLIAQTLSSYLKASKDSDPLLIIPQEGDVLEQALISQGLPAMGYISTYENGVLSQLPLLMTLFLWKPYDPEKLLQYLSIKSAPLAKTLRTKLAEAYADTPGVGNEKWNKTIEKYLPEDDEKKKNKTLEKIARWFDRERFPIELGAPAVAIIKLYEDLQNWADASAAYLEDSDSKKKPLKQLSSQCQTLIEIIQSEHSDDDLISQIELTQWLQELSSTSSSIAQQTEIGALDHINNPAAITSEVETIVWWNFLETSNPLARSAQWSDAEQQALKGTALHRDKMKLDTWYWQLCNGVLCAGKRLILCIPEKSQGELVNVNQLYYDLEATFDNLNSLTTTVNLHQPLELFGNKIETIIYDEKALPVRKAAWQIDFNELPPRREYDSFSSLKYLFFYPYAYVLKYILKIKPTSIPQIVISPLLLGNLTHHAAEELWNDENILNYESDQLRETVQKVLDDHIQKAGIILLMPKNRGSLQEFKDTVTKALLNLIKIIKENGWTILESEQKHTITGAMPVLGLIDLVLKRGKEIAIVDLKWGGASSRQKELIEERELQLIIYDRLLKEKDRRIHLHYYIITSSKMLGRNNAAFQETVTISSKEEELTHRKAIWDRMVKTYKLRWEQIEAGFLEVGDGMFVSQINGCKELYSDDENYLNIPLESKKKKEDDYSDYKNLLGAL